MSNENSGTPEPGIYVRGLEYRTASTRSEAVALVFDGFARQVGHLDEPEPDDVEQPDTEPDSLLDRVFMASGAAPISLERGAWDTYYPAFAAAVRGLGAAPVDPWDAVATAVVLDAARLSAETGQTVKLSEKSS